MPSALPLSAAPLQPVLPGTKALRLVLLTVCVIAVHGLLLGGYLPVFWPGNAAAGPYPVPQAYPAFTLTAVSSEPAPAVAQAPEPPGVPAAARVQGRSSPPSGVAPAASVIPVQTPDFGMNQPAVVVNTAPGAPVVVAEVSPGDPPANAPSPGQGPGQSGAANALAAAAPFDVTTPLPYVFPEPARLKYDLRGEVKGIPYSASGELLWQHDGKNYEARMEISLFIVSRVQTSRGQLTALGLEPLRFGDKVRSEVAAHFERSKGKVTFSANTPDVALTPGTQDQLSVFLQLASMLGAGVERFPAGTSIAFQAIGPRSAENWVFQVGTLERVKLPGGEISALKLTREAPGDFAPRGEMWMAPELGYLPVRIRLTQGNGEFVDQQWRSTQKP